MNIKLDQWTADAESDSCVRVTVDKGIPLENLKMKIVNGERQTLLSCNLESHDVTFCFETGLPLYVELSSPGSLPSMRYVEHSGSKAYAKLQR